MFSDDLSSDENEFKHSSHVLLLRWSSFHFTKLSLSLTSLSLDPATSPVSLSSPPVRTVAGGKPPLLSPLFFSHFGTFWAFITELKFWFLRYLLYDFWHEIYGFWWGECVEHDRNLQIDFWTSFDRRAFWSETLIADLGRLMRFLMKWSVDLGSLGWLELIGMLEMVGWCLVRD